MTYDEFQHQIGKAGLSVHKFTDQVKMHRNSLTNHAKHGKAQSLLVVIATLLSTMANKKVDFRSILDSIGIEPKKPRGGATKGLLGGSKQTDLPME